MIKQEQNVNKNGINKIIVTKTQQHRTLFGK